MKSVWSPALQPVALGVADAPRPKHHTKVSRFFRKLTDAQVVALVACVCRATQETHDIDPARVRAACQHFVETQP